MNHRKHEQQRRRTRREARRYAAWSHLFSKHFWEGVMPFCKHHVLVLAHKHRGPIGTPPPEQWLECGNPDCKWHGTRCSKRKSNGCKDFAPWPTNGGTVTVSGDATVIDYGQGAEVVLKLGETEAEVSR